MKKNSYKRKFFLLYLPIAALVLVSQSLSSDGECLLPSAANCWFGECRTQIEICTTDEDGNCWEPPRVIEEKCFSKVRQDEFCPVYPKLRENHTAYLIDTTDGPSKQFTEKLDVLFNVDAEFVRRNKPYTRITIVELSDKQSVAGFKPLGTICRPRTGTITPWQADLSHPSEGQLAIKADFTNKFWSPIKQLLPKLAESTPANHTLIVEHISELAKQPIYQFTGEEYQNRRLVILSDLLQYSDRLKLVRECRKPPEGCSSFDYFYSQTNEKIRMYLDEMKPKLDEFSRVEIHHIQNKAVRDSRIEDQLKSFWIGFFEWAGVPKENIDYNLLPDNQ